MLKALIKLFASHNSFDFMHVEKLLVKAVEVTHNGQSQQHTTSTNS